MKAHLHMLVALVILAAMTVVLVGCSSSGGGTVFLNVLQRTSWQQTATGRLSLASIGGNGLPYIYIINNNGSGLALLTPSFNENPPINVLEGGSNPSFSPDGNTIAFVSRRGGANNTSQTIYSMPTLTGDRSTLTSPLQPLPNDSNSADPQGADRQPNWSPDGTLIIYSSTRSDGYGSIRTIPAAGGTPTQVLPTGNDNQWPCYNPQNAQQIVFQSNAGLTGTDPITGLAPTGIFVYDAGTKTTTQILPDPSNPDHFTYGAPSWSPDGTKIAFHSDRAGDYDIWVYTLPVGGGLQGGTLTHITSDARSDGFPVWNMDGSRLAFTRDRELWTCLSADGSDQQQLTKRYQ